MDDGFKALADPTRRRILSLLRDRSLTAGEIGRHFTMRAASLSHHLSLLSRAGLVKRHRRGRNIVYSLNEEGIDALLDDLERFRVPEDRLEHGSQGAADQGRGPTQPHPQSAKAGEAGS